MHDGGANANIDNADAEWNVSYDGEGHVHDVDKVYVRAHVCTFKAVRLCSRNKFICFKCSSATHTVIPVSDLD